MTQILRVEPYRAPYTIERRKYRAVDLNVRIDPLYSRWGYLFCYEGKFFCANNDNSECYDTYVEAVKAGEHHIDQVLKFGPNIDNIKTVLLYIAVIAAFWFLSTIRHPLTETSADTEQQQSEVTDP